MKWKSLSVVKNRLMRVAEIAPLWKTVPPLKYGGVESVVSMLTEGLVKAGVDVSLFACGGSKTSGKLVEIVDKPVYDIVGGFFWNAISPYDFLLFKQLVDKLNEFDVIHNHMGFHPLVFSKLIKVPIVTTLHSSLEPDFPYLAKAVKDNNFVSISNSQRELAPYLNYVQTIYHGIETDKFRPNTESKDYFLFIGSLTKNKGVDIAVQACNKLGKNLIVAGEVRESDAEFWNKEVMPFIDGKKIKFVGEVGGVDKINLYAGAKALLFPIRWSEAFGLVMTEAMSCGTPVIAFNKGSVPEIIKDGETGFVVDNFETFLDRINRINEISRDRCRKETVNRFDVEIMTKNYISLFERIIKTE